MQLLINSEKEVINVLVIEDSCANREAILDMMREEYPHAKITAPENLFNEDVKSFIISGHFSHILLDSSLAKWGYHPEFGEWGENFIPFIKKYSPGTEIVAIAADNQENERMLGKGADFAIEKKHFERALFAKEFLS